MTDKAACIAVTICAHGYLQNPEDEGRVAHVIRQSLESPEPHADDVETIRVTREEANMILDSLNYGSRLAGNYAYCAEERDCFDRPMAILDAALTRLSAPIDVQTKAEAVVKDYCGTYVLTDLQKEKLSQLIVEQFSIKE
jgi:hypothetical protein